MKKLLLTFCLGITAMPLWATEAPSVLHQATSNNQSTVSADKLPNEPVKLLNYMSLMVDYGFNLLQNSPDELEARAQGARFLNGSLQYNFRLGKSCFTISTGIGVGSERYQFKKKAKEKYHALGQKKEDTTTEFTTTDTLLKGGSKATNASLDTNFLDFIVELKFNANRVYPKDGFFVAVGFKPGLYLLDSFQRISYEHNSQSKKLVNHENFDIRQMRYGFHVKVGWNRVSLFYAQTLSSLFGEKGPKVKATPHKVGISLDLF